jgi:Galactose oxidase, central domain
VDRKTLSSIRRRVDGRRSCSAPRVVAVTIAAVLGSVLVGPGVANASGVRATLLQPPTWQALTPAVQPGPRAGASLAYDQANHMLVLWGGGEPTGGLSAVVAGDTWGFDGSRWHRLPTGPARIRASFVFDPNIKSLVAFGGSSPTAVTGDTWTFDGHTWKQIAVTGPPAREGAAMAYDPKLHEIVLFGGDTNQAVNLGDTWVWRPKSGWVQRSSPNAPAARFGSSMAYDPKLGKLLLFGGETDLGVQNDTWTFDGSTWQQVPTPTPPAPRVQQAMTYDARLHAVVLWGGVGAFGDLGDTWLFDGLQWTALPAGGTGPGPQQGQEAALAYDPVIRSAVLIGGAGAQVGISGAEWALR